MFCEHPIRIRNQYSGKWMHVNCRNCQSCMINDANRKGVELATYLTRFKFLYFVTLTYNDDNVPFIVEGSNSVFRGQDEIDVLGEFEEEITNPLDYTKCREIKTHAISGAIGVLWYDDVVRFLKRLRKYINKNYGRKEFKYFCVGEYGTRFKRPHFHLIFGFNDFSYQSFKGAVLQNWKLCNWNRLYDEKGRFKGVERIDKGENGKGTAYYTASYVNNISGNTGICAVKCFRQKTRRSKDMAFGTDFSLYEDFKEDVIRVFNESFRCFDMQPFYWLDCSKKDNISVRLISQRYLHTLFYKFKGWNSLPIEYRVSRACTIVEYCQNCEKLGLSLSYDSINFRSADLSFYRAYKRFCKDFESVSSMAGYSSLKNVYKYGLKRSFTPLEYTLIMDKVLKYYDSQVLRSQMEKSENMPWQDYVLSLIDTKVECSNMKERMFVKNKYIRKYYTDNNIDWSKNPYWKPRVFRMIDETCPPFVKQELLIRKEKYKKILLPKHFNDISGVLG